MSEKTIKRIESFVNAFITTLIAGLIWCLADYLILGRSNPSNVDAVMSTLFFFYVYWRNMKEGNE